MDNLKYVQAVSRVRVLEKKLLDRTKVDSLAESKDGNEALRILQETEYGHYMTEVKRPEDYESLLTSELKRLYELMYELCPERSVIDIMSIKYDYHNIRVLLKGKILGKDLDYLMVDVGTMNPLKLKSIYRDGHLRDLPEYMKMAFIQGEKSFDESGDPQKIDIVVDNFLYKDILERSKSIGNKFISDFVKINIDLINIKTFLRIKSIDAGGDFLKSLLIEGGSIDIDVFFRLYNESVDSLPSRLSHTDYKDLISKGVEEYQSSGKLNTLERLGDDFLMDYVKDSIFVSFGPEPLISYIYGKESEIKDVRIIMVGKINSVPPQAIKERLRDVYV